MWCHFESINLNFFRLDLLFNLINFRTCKGAIEYFFIKLPKDLHYKYNITLFNGHLRFFIC